MMKRNISITLEQAKEWYESDNEILKELALSAFNEDELEDIIDYETLVTKNDSFINTSYHIGLVLNNKNTQDQVNFLARLYYCSIYFNKDWVKTNNSTGYFIKSFNPFEITYHDSVTYPGIIYFKERKDLIKSVKIINKFMAKYDEELIIKL